MHSDCAVLRTPVQHVGVNVLLVPFLDAHSTPCRFLYITRGSLILADTIVLVLTWIRTFGHWRQARHANIGVSVTTCLLRDGTVYFMTLLVANFIQMLTYNFPASVSPASVIVTALPPVLINRFMINLRTIDSEMPDYSLHIGDQQRRQATLQFRRPANRLGNIGETLQDGWSDELWDEENNTAEVDEEGRRETSTEDCTEV
ncbi:uncharacterized protein PHACADRAFT_206528 [Phanerochaete carnosa HHB-10118-sp]|uniref:Uncharacterized protein n=1 Tax=Phanerochaete carnosa (strain HHB-10118-sp) TaxID=650164 RepID=K5W1B0_PHACS|nr:uncharacterized protein PHACADRAFT_206528 [Phanerochaete carnosa HHB-10118-sp]EKM57643.1 hypothetical protein PHACADRAFT_206528 [Phanerochaete carnosa HHB-10118-sp]